ncbi:MAG: CYTH domain-containing protein [Candidatus Hatepunaea meridiana]|nr:CYTH domain-containing protein [Candidatus Hatepunaea meridiana]
MSIEIERKFLVKSDAWRKDAKGNRIRQGYISTDKQSTVRVRTVDNKGYLTIKGISIGISRAEYEYEIPLKDADEMLSTLCVYSIIEKTRYKIDYGGLVWEVDEFEGDNLGLIVAEVELTDENQEVELPDWIGGEVTGDPRYFNSNLAKCPYREW